MDKWMDTRAPLIGTSRMLSRLGGIVVMGRSAHRLIAGYVRVSITMVGRLARCSGRSD